MAPVPAIFQAPPITVISRTPRAITPVQQSQGTATQNTECEIIEAPQSSNACGGNGPSLPHLNVSGVGGVVGAIAIGGAGDAGGTAVGGAGALGVLSVGSNGPAAIGPAGNAGAFPGLRATEKSLQHTFKHAANFGVIANWSKATGSLLENVLSEHILAETTLRIPGTYRNVISVIHNVDPLTGLNVMQTPAGDLISGWRLGIDQLGNVLTRGSL
jgi:hypothetical protein